MQPHREFRGWKWGGGTPRSSWQSSPRTFHCCTLVAAELGPAPASGSEGLKGSSVPSLLLVVALNNTLLQEQFTNGGETKIKNLSPIFDQTLSGLPHESSMGLILRGKWPWNLQRSGCLNCTSNIIPCCTHTAPGATLRGFLHTHNLNTRDIQQDSLLQLSKSLEITTFSTSLKKHWKHDMTKSWLILRLQFTLMAFSS